MAYRRKTKSTSKKSYRKAAPKRTYRRKAAPKRKAAKRKAPAERRIVLVVQQAPVVNPALAQAGTKPRLQRARFGG